MVYIEIRDTDNSIIGRLDVGQSDEFPLVLNKGVSDYSVINKRSGIYSFDFEIPLTESNASLFPNIYNANLKDTKQFFKRKDCIIYSDEILIAQGQLQVKEIKKQNGVNYLLCAFFGDNLEWVTKLSEMTLNEVNFQDTTFTLDFDTITGSWTNTADTNDYVFPYIEYGQLGRYANATKVEEYRPALFIKRVLDTAFNQIGFTIQSSFFDTSSFKGLVLSYFTDFEDNRWINEDGILNDNFVNTTMSAYVDKTYLSTQKYYNTYTGARYTCEESVASRAIPINQKSGTGSSVYNTSTYTYSSFSYFGVYTFEYNVDVSVKTSPSDGNGALRLYCYNSRTGKHLVSSTSCTSPKPMTGQFSLDIQSGDSVTFYLDYYCYTQVTLTNNSNVCNINRAIGEYRINASTFIKGTVSRNISYSKVITLSKVLSKSYSVLNLINDVSRLFNLYWRTNNATKIVYVEPRDTLYYNISHAIDKTQNLDLTKGYTLKDTQSELSRYYSFNYLQDDNDKLITEYNKKAKNEDFDLLGSYSRYDLGSGYVDEEEKNETQKVSFSVIKGVKKTYQYPFTACLWTENTYDPPVHSTTFNPRILNYVYSSQTLSKVNDYSEVSGTYVAKTVLRVVDPFIFNTTDPLIYGEAFETFGFCLTQDLYLIDGTLVASAPINLDYKDAKILGQSGLLNSYYKGTLNNIKEGKILNCSLRMSKNEFRNINLFKPIYFSVPEEIQGYWLIEEINGFNVSKNDNIVSVRLIKFANSEPLNANVTGEMNAEGFRDVEPSEQFNFDTRTYTPSTTGLLAQ